MSRTASTLISGVVCGITISGAQAEVARGEGDALRVIAGARRDDAARALGVGEVGDPVVGAAQLVAEDRLQVLALEQDLVAEPPRQPRRRLERRLVRDVVDAAGQDQPQHRVGGRDRPLGAAVSRLVTI